MLSIRNIVKEYAKHRALDNVSMEVERGTVFGLLGPNGAGKTSLIRIINQITGPDSGEIFFNGEQLNQSHISKIGYLPEERGLYKKMEIGEQMLYLAQLKGLKRADAIQRIKYWFEKMEMQNWWKKKVEDLSKGMQQKVQFVATVLHEPELIILDEPFSGFDPVNAEIIKDEILELNQKGSTIIFSTHRMESVEQLCNHIVLLNKSHKILDGGLKEIKNSYRNDTFKVEFSGDIARLTHQTYDLLSHAKQNDYELINVRLKPGFSANHLLSELIPNVQIVHLEEVIPSINQIFIEKVNQVN